MKLPILELDLGTYGKQTVDFSEYVTITSDLIEELHKDASNYAYIESISVNLKGQIKRKQNEYEALKGTRSSEVTAELVGSGKKATAKAVDAVLASDETLLRFAEETAIIEDNSALITALLRAMSMRHSDLKKLVELEINGMAMGRLNVKEPEEAPVHRVKKDVDSKPRGRGKR